MFTKIMMWVSIVVVLLTLLGLPVTTETILVETLLCVSGLLVVCQAIRASNTSLRPDSCRLSRPSVPSHPLPRPARLLSGLVGSASRPSWLRLWS
jgi:hypothetical protein